MELSLDLVSLGNISPFFVKIISAYRKQNYQYKYFTQKSSLSTKSVKSTQEINNVNTKSGEQSSF